MAGGGSGSCWYRTRRPIPAETLSELDAEDAMLMLQACQEDHDVLLGWPHRLGQKLLGTRELIRERLRKIAVDPLGIGGHSLLPNSRLPMRQLGATDLGEVGPVSVEQSDGKNFGRDGKCETFS
jgi:hypothetical protein